MWIVFIYAGRGLGGEVISELKPLQRAANFGSGKKTKQRLRFLGESYCTRKVLGLYRENFLRVVAQCEPLSRADHLQKVVA